MLDRVAKALYEDARIGVDDRQFWDALDLNDPYDLAMRDCALRQARAAVNAMRLLTRSMRAASDEMLAFAGLPKVPAGFDAQDLWSMLIGYVLSSAELSPEEQKICAKFGITEASLVERA